MIFKVIIGVAVLVSTIFVSVFYMLPLIFVPNLIFHSFSAFCGFFILFYFFLFFIFGCVGVFVSVRGLSLVVASGGHSSSRCAGLSPSRPLPLWSTGPRRTGSVVVAHGPSCSAACGIFPDQGSNLCPLH